jgi:preprotein translocase subunit SecA
MFEAMMGSIDDDFVKYVMHVDVVVERAEEPDLSQAQYQAPEGPVQSPGARGPGVEGNGAGTSPLPAPVAPSDPGTTGGAGSPPAPAPQAHAPIVKSDQEKIGRNQPCWCGSNKKYKLCHGR